MSETMNRNTKGGRMTPGQVSLGELEDGQVALDTLDELAALCNDLTSSVGTLEAALGTVPALMRYTVEVVEDEEEVKHWSVNGEVGAALDGVEASQNVALVTLSALGCLTGSLGVRTDTAATGTTTAVVVGIYAAGADTVGPFNGEVGHDLMAAGISTVAAPSNTVSAEPQAVAAAVNISGEDKTVADLATGTKFTVWLQLVTLPDVEA